MKRKQIMRDVELVAIVAVWLVSAVLMVALVVGTAARGAW